MEGWIDARECIPFADGEYIVQTVYGRVTSMNYTHEAGWNTHRDDDGVLHKGNAMEYGYVVRWYYVPMPKPVPKELLDKYIEERQVSRCAIE